MGSLAGAGLGLPAHRCRVPRAGGRLGRGRGAARPQRRQRPPPPARPLRPLLRLARDPAARTADPWAYRVFFRQIGLDPDRTRTPVEQLAIDRLQDGAFRSRGQPSDALTIATVETGVALRAFDADRLQGRLCIRDSAPGEALAGRPGELAQGTLTLADDSDPVGLLFGATAEGYGVTPASRRIAVAAIEVRGVPQIAVEEALWMAASELARR